MQEIVDDLPTEIGSGRVFGDPYETIDGTTVIPAMKVRSVRGAFMAKPAGAVVVKDGKASWVGAVDETHIAMAGIFVGLAAVVLFGVAGIRRPPWPDVRVWVTRRR
jgi:hypothetical protein